MVRKSVVISNKQHARWTVTHVVAKQRATLVENLVHELSLFMLGVRAGAVLVSASHCWTTLLLEDEDPCSLTGKIAPAIMQRLVPSLRTICNSKGDCKINATSCRAQGAAQQSPFSPGQPTVLVDTVERLTDSRGTLEWSIFKVVTPQWRDSPMVFTTLNVLVQQCGGTLLAAEVRVEGNVLGMVLCMQDTASRGAFTAAQLHVAHNTLRTHLLRMVANGGEEAAAHMPPPLVLREWVATLVPPTLARINVLTRGDAAAAFADPMLGDLVSPPPPPPSVPYKTLHTHSPATSQRTLDTYSLEPMSPSSLSPLSIECVSPSSSVSTSRTLSLPSIMQSAAVAGLDSTISSQSSNASLRRPPDSPLSSPRHNTAWVSRTAPSKISPSSRPSKMRTMSSPELPPIAATPLRPMRTQNQRSCAPANHCWDDMPWAQRGAPPCCMDDFELLTQLGSGFTSVVYAARVRRARTLAPGKDDIVVLKVMPKRRAVELGVEQLTVQERANLELIQGSRFILHLFGCFQDPWAMVLVTELATGDFFDFMTDEFGTAQYWKALPLYAAEVLLGLEWMHRRGLLYRDLKPENLLMRADGHLVLSDFGMSTRLQPGQRATRVCGTAVYMSPEVLAEQGYGFMSELWSYGVLLHELFTGITPFLVEESSARSANELVADRIRRMTCQHTGAVLFDDSAYMNADAKHLITSLLQVDEATRLGAADDAGDYRSIKSHPWFANINWAGLEAGLYKPTITVPVNLPAEPDVLGLPWATGKPLTAKSSRDKFGAFCLSHTV